MGYQDRDYFREEQTPYLDLIRSTRVCWGIVIVIAIVFCLCLFTQDTAQPLQEYLRLEPQTMVKEWQWYRLLTATLVAQNPWHLVFALLVIWMIGHELEEQVGGLEFFAFFLLTALLSNLAVTLVSLAQAPIERAVPPALGPIGPAMAMLTWSVTQVPQRTVSYFFIPMPFWIVGLLAIVIDWFFFQQVVPVELRLAVHVLTISFAMVYSFNRWRITGWSRWIRLPRQVVRRPLTLAARAVSRDRAVVQETEKEPFTLKRAVDEQLEAKLDAVLEKVSQSGMASLTDNEKITLQRASEVMKRRKGEH